MKIFFLLFLPVAFLHFTLDIADDSIFKLLDEQKVFVITQFEGMTAEITSEWEETRSRITDKRWGEMKQQFIFGAIENSFLYPELIMKGKQLLNLVGDDYCVFLGDSSQMLKTIIEILGEKSIEKFKSIMFSGSPGIIHRWHHHAEISAQGLHHFLTYLDHVGMQSIHGSSTKLYIADVFDFGYSLFSFMRILRLYYQLHKLEMPNIVFLALNKSFVKLHNDSVFGDDKSLIADWNAGKVIVKLPKNQLEIDAITLDIANNVLIWLLDELNHTNFHPSVYFPAAYWDRDDFLEYSSGHGHFWEEFKLILTNCISTTNDQLDVIFAIEKNFESQLLEIKESKSCNLPEISESIESSVLQVPKHLLKFYVRFCISNVIKLARILFDAELYDQILNLSAIWIPRLPIGSDSWIDLTVITAKSNEILGDSAQDRKTALNYWRTAAEYSNICQECISFKFMDQLESAIGSLSSLKATKFKFKGNYEILRNPAFAKKLYLQGLSFLSEPLDGEADEKVFADLHLNLNFCCLKIGEAQEALDHALLIVESKLNSPKAHYRLGCAYEMLYKKEKDEHKAGEYLKMALEHFHNSPESKEKNAKIAKLSVKQ